MLANLGRGTSPEVALRAALRAAGARGYRLNFRAEGVRPDIVFTRPRVAVFLHGCFWHRCPTCRYPLPKSHRDFWVAKFRRNRARDRMKRRILERAGWRVVEVWEHELGDDLERVSRAISLAASPQASVTSIPRVEATARAKRRSVVRRATPRRSARET
jgi:DNA mismatch endonuclease (patch repair protein)